MKSFVTFFFLMCFFVHQSCGIKGGTAVTEPLFVTAVLKEIKADGADSTYELVATGSEINKGFVLTAASFHKEGENYKVMVGRVDSTYEGEEIEVDNCIKYHNYVETSPRNNIALLKLKTNISNPIDAGLLTVDELELTDLETFGFGNLADTNETESLVTLSVATGNLEKKCVNGVAANENVAYKDLLCMDDSAENFETFDVGSPLTRADLKVFALATATEEKITYYTPIDANMLDWIEKNSGKPTRTTTTKPTTTTKKPSPDTTKAPVTTTKKPTPKKRGNAALSSSLSLKLLIAIASARAVLIFV